MRIDLPPILLRNALRVLHACVLVASVAMLAVPSWRTGWPHHGFIALVFASWSIDVWGSWRRGHLGKTLPELHAAARAGEPLLSRDPLERVSSAAGMIALFVVTFAS